MTPGLHLHSVLNILHQMRTPKPHDHHDHNDKNPQKQELLIITNNKTIKDALTYKNGTDGDEKGTRGLRNASVCCANRVISHGCDDSVLQSSCMVLQYAQELTRTFLHTVILKGSSTYILHTTLYSCHR
jgi:hypothetical protein